MAWVSCSSLEKNPAGASLVFWASQGAHGCDNLLFFLVTKGQNLSTCPALKAGAVLALHGHGVTGFLGLASLPL